MQIGEFLVLLFVAEKIFSISLPLSKYSQTVSLDFFSVLRLADDVLFTACNLRSRAEEVFRELFEHVMSVCEKLGY